MSFNYYNPVKLITGKGCVQNNAHIFLKLGKSCLIVTGGSSAKKSGALNDVIAALESIDAAYEVFDGIGQNPELLDCVKAGEIARTRGCDFIIGIGGGSPLDAAKAVAVYAANPEIDGMDVYQNNWPNPALPIAVIGTTAGTGSEVTCFSILTMPNGRKKSFGNEETYPKVMFGDHRYTRTLPFDFTKSTALDALAHALEAYFNLTANDMSDMYAIEAVRLMCPCLRVLRDTKGIDGLTDEWREKMYFASIVAGYALSQCGTLFCHNIGYHFTENYDVPHGFACAVTLPDLIERGVTHSRERAERLFAAANTSANELCEIISDVTVFPEIKLTKDVIEQISQDGAQTKNYTKTIPDGFSVYDANKMLMRIFGK